MGFVDLFAISSMPVVKVLLISGLGSYLALDQVDILGETARKNLNTVAFYVFNPALVSSNLAQTITLESITLLWFMPLNILLSFILGSALGWTLTKITKAPKHLKGLVIASCAAGNLGFLPLVIIPTICQEKGSPFGAQETCRVDGIAYASLSMAIGAIYLWSYVYNIVRLSSSKSAKISHFTQHPFLDNTFEFLPGNQEKEQNQIPFSIKIKQMLSGKINLKAIFAPATIGAITGFSIGLVPILKKLMIGGNAPLHVLHDSASLLGEATIPTITLIVGGNLLKGLKGSSTPRSIIIGILAVRYILLPLLGVLVMKGALHFGMVHSDPLYQFVLLLQFALPPAMNIGTMTQLFGEGESECSVILLCTYSLASISLTLWPTYFMWLVA